MTEYTMTLDEVEEFLNLNGELIRRKREMKQDASPNRKFRKPWIAEFIREEWMKDGVETRGASDTRIVREDPSPLKLGTLMPQENLQRKSTSKE